MDTAPERLDRIKKGYYKIIDSRKKEGDKQQRYGQLSNQPEPAPVIEDKGKQFEVFLELLLRQKARKEGTIYQVEKNIVYQKRSGEQREVDIHYLIKKQSKLLPIFVEAKYTSKNTLPFWLGEEKTKNGRIIDGIDNHVTEIEERMRFANGYQTVLASNKPLNPHILERIDIANRFWAAKRGQPAIHTMDGADLLHEYRQLGGRQDLDLEDVISMVHITKSDYRRTYRNI